MTKYAIVANHKVNQHEKYDVIQVYESEENLEGKGTFPSVLDGGEYGAVFHVPVPEGLNANALKGYDKPEVKANGEYDGVAYEGLSHDDFDIPVDGDTTISQLVSTYSITHNAPDDSVKPPAGVIELRNGNPSGMGVEEDSELLAQAIEKQKQVDITAKYNEMRAEIYDQVEAVFGSRNDDTANAQYETWKLMVQKPSLFSDEGLIADKDAGFLNKGDALDTVEKINEYASTRINDVEQFSIFRSKRRKQFTDEKAAIEAQ